LSAGRLVQALCARLQAETGAPVELHETHISWVLLAGSLAYKLKKPVRLPFVDFSSLAARRLACEEELRLNRRLAPSLYLDVLPVCASAGAPRLGGPGEVIDHVVRMRRFESGALLSERLASGRLQPGEVDRLAERIAGFHRAAPSAVPPSPYLSAGHAAEPVRALLERWSGPGLETVGDWLHAQARALAPAFEQRAAAGKVREVHGDLHLANCIAWHDDITAFDCIEFDPALRWIDVASDAAFPAMDLQARGRPDFAARYVDQYLQHSGDHDALRVWRFFAVYRALVRASVARLQAGEGPDYVACARALAAGPRVSPRLLITRGLSGSGKSTLAARLLEATDAVRLRSDVERKRLFGLDATQRSAVLGLDLYTPHATQRTFERLEQLAADALAAGWPVIVDAAFLRRAERDRFRALAQRLRLPFTILDCGAPDAVLRARITQRQASAHDPSEADLAVLQRQLEWNEALGDDERALAIEQRTDAPVDADDLAARWRR
jgi:hypothetical protein